MSASPFLWRARVWRLGQLGVCRCSAVACWCVWAGGTAGQAKVLSDLPGLVFNGYRLHVVLTVLLHTKHMNNSDAGRARRLACL